MCPALNLRWLYKLAISDLQKLRKSNRHDKIFPNEEEVRRRTLKHAIINKGSLGLYSSVMQGKRRSDSSDEALIADFQTFEQPKHPVPRDKHYMRALKVTEKLFRPTRTLHPISFPDLTMYPWTKNVSAEAPYNYKKSWMDYLRQKHNEGEIDNFSPTFHNLEDEIFLENRNLIHHIKDGYADFWNKDGTPKPYFHTTLHARAHVVDTDDDDKIRAVFGVPKLLLMAENMFIWPLQAHYLNSPTTKHNLLWENEIMKGGWKKLYRQFESPQRKTYLSLDWSEFDKRALHEVIDDVHVMWRSWFDFSKYEPTVFYPDASPPDAETRMGRLWYWMTDMVKHYPILQPDGNVYQWTRNGIASGFQQTQLLDSFVNTIMLLTCLSADGINIEAKHFKIKVQGDDSLIAFAERRFDVYGPQYLDRLAKSAEFYFNAKLSVKKSFCNGTLNTMYVLGYYNSYGIPFRTDEDLLSHLVFPERPQKLEQLAASCVGIAMATNGCSPVVYSICEDVHRFLTTQMLITPDEEALKWMKRTNIFEDIPNVAKMPSFLSIQDQSYQIPIRSESQKQRLWPTEPGHKPNDFHFLNNIC
jgi:hypothetical protein